MTDSNLRDTGGALLRTLGRLGLEGSAEASRRPRLLLLLARLAAARAATQSRAELATLFWEKSGERRARQSLRQALLELRRILGPDALELEGDEVRLTPGRIVLDAGCFAAHVEAGRYAEAIALWHGDFLAGYEDAGGAAFRAWLESERARLRRFLATACAAAVETSLAAGEADEAASHAACWSDALPADEDAHRAVLRTLTLAGRVREAAARHDAFITRLRGEFGLEPSAALLAAGAALGGTDAEAPTPGPGSDRAAVPRPPELVGRADARAAFVAAWSAVRSGGDAAVLVDGPPGTGRTRLLEAFLEHLAVADPAPFTLHTAAYRGERAVPWAALRDLLVDLSAAPGLAGAPDAELAVLAALAPGIRERYPRLPPTPAPEVDAVARALNRVLRDVATETPVLVAVDDADVLDPASRAVLLALIRRVPPGVLVVATAADDGRDPDLNELVAQRRLRRVTIGPLDAADTERLVHAMVDLEPDHRRDFAAWLHEHHAGHLLATVTLIEALVDAAIATASGDLRRLPTGPRGTHRRDLHRFAAAALRRRGMHDAAAIHEARCGGAGRRRIMIFAAAALALVTAAAAATALFSGRNDAPASVVAILPFTVLGSSDLDYLAEGMVDLLGARLDGFGELRTIDPHAVLAASHAAPGVRRARRLAARLGAGSFILGSVMSSGDRVRVRADLHDRAGRAVASVEAQAPDTALFQLVDDLARRLAATLPVADDIAALPAAATRSLPALEAFLAGERAFRRGRYAEALDEYRRAAALDTTFAPAHYRVAVAAEFGGTMDRGVFRDALDRAIRHAQALGWRERTFLQAFAAWHHGAPGTAEASFRAIVAEYPRDVMAWYGLGEVLMHDGVRVGRPDALADARHAFHRVLELDPDHAEALLHLVRIATALDDPRAARAALDRLASTRLADAPILVTSRALHAFAHGNDDDRDVALRDISRQPPISALIAASFVATYAADPAGAADLIATLTRDGNPARVRAAAYAFRAHMLASAGAHHRAIAELHRAAELAPRPAARAAALIAPASPTPEAADTAHLRRWLLLLRDAPPEPPPGPDDLPGFTSLAGIEHAADAYAAGLLHAALGELHLARTIADSITRLTASDSTLRDDLARGLRADIAFRQGRLDDAARELRDIRFATWHQFAVVSPFHALARERALRNRILRLRDGLQPASDGTGSTPFDLLHSDADDPLPGPTPAAAASRLQTPELADSVVAAGGPGG